MDKQEKRQSIIFRIKIFCWYIFTEPIRQAKELLKVFNSVLIALNRAKTWIYILIFLLGISFVYRQKYESMYFAISLLIMLFWWEWERGYFMKRYRDHYKSRLNKKAEEVMKNE